MRDLHFKDNFWNTELTCTAGYDAIIQHLNDGKRTCKEVEDFMKARAAIEEKYAKELLGLSKKVCGHNEMNTLKRSLDMFKLQTEHVSLSHLTLAQTMREEARRLEDFRERQKEARKKLYTKAQQAKQTAEEADKMYIQNVSVLGKIQDDWQKEHAKACEVFEKQEVERISTLRNMVWTHLNHLSQQCVTSDELYEEVRKSLEQCDIQEDIGHFINLRRTGHNPPAPVLYENFYSGQRSTGPCPSPRQPPPISRRGPLPDPVNNAGDVAYATVQEPGYSLLHY
ncbi:proline-serine-threonine phosphatase-interacting protein 2 isoform X3 [Osmerus eperlanus]|uniref:proline-serine-threonine phosphatase-interacting protein 2 isoform X3 n=1 Tax=Osmerus eperlanus TaxID=29151 RepID=UPI002E147B74